MYFSHILLISRNLEIFRILRKYAESILFAPRAENVTVVQRFTSFSTDGEVVFAKVNEKCISVKSTKSVVPAGFSENH